MTAPWPGKPYPLGATADAEGVNFALFSRHATAVELCLFDAQGRETRRLPLPERTDLVWHGYAPGLAAGQRYGYRVHGPWDPAAGHRFNPNKVLLDPYARAVARDLRWDDAMFGYALGSPEADLAMDRRDSAAFAPLGAVAAEGFDWGGDRPPRRSWQETLIYELHVKGFTKLHPDVPEKLRGTYAGLASKPAVDHLLSLGVTAVELMPVHHRVDDRQLVERGLSNYWGYNTLAFFAPDRRYASDPADAAGEFKRMVKTLHAAGIEVILDVVYNHTAEGSHLGPTLSLRGVDNASYYRLVAGSPRHYMDYTGCGNSLNMSEPRVLQLIMDSLRYWAVEMRVDGFRFDLAAALARELHEVDHLSAFFDIIQQDPVLSRLKLIAEPWDLGEGGYQAGNFPAGWAEWNGEYRDAVRRLWKGDAPGLGELATRLSGSSDLYGRSGRRPCASVNFVTCHDGFTLEDLVSYESKRNEANGEDNRDGSDNNLSFNCGVEGPTGDGAVLALRERQKRNLLGTLLLSQGVPMLRAGDELSHTQRGNNNAYCQDNELSWLDWSLDDRKSRFLEFARSAARMRASQPVLRRRQFLRGRARGGGKDIAWFEASGHEMREQAWNDPSVRALAVKLSGDAIDDVDARGRPIVGDSLLILVNAGREPVTFSVPAAFGRTVNVDGPGLSVIVARAGAPAPASSVGAMAAPAPEGACAAAPPAAAGFVPVSTYRLQLGPGFPFSAATALVPYLAGLGVDAVYLSPIFKAQPGSTHGYDVVDPNELNPELGGWAAYEDFCAALKQRGLAQIIDAVPNHMGIAGDHNRFWQDVLAHGQRSAYAAWFDIDWEPVKPELKGKVLVPVLDDLFGRVLEEGRIRVELTKDGPAAVYGGSRYPLDTGAWEGPLDEREARGLNGRPGEPGSFDRLDALLARQNYRLAHWRVASDEINYRRFFNINELAAVRTEDDDVFEATHRLLFRLVAEGKVQGLRIDHPDGLYDPPGYFAKLQRRHAGPSPLYVVIEKVLDRKEPLPESWSVHGTVGYEALNALNGLYVDRDNEKRFDEIYRGFIGHAIDFQQLIWSAKRRFATRSMGGEVAALGHRLDRISEQSRHFRDFTRASLTAALREVIDHFPVYRTYVAPEGPVSERDERFIRIAVERAKAAASHPGPDVFDFVRDVLLLKLEDRLPREQRPLYRDFVLRFQQLTAPVMAKGYEDTALYIDSRLISLNEVGGDPSHFGMSPGDFHKLNAERARRWPAALTTTSTHDTKRSEDARQRVNALSELPEEWQGQVALWSRINEKNRGEVGGSPSPSRNTEYFLYQTLLAAWPDENLDEAGMAAFGARLWPYALKALREAKLHTDWSDPNPPYEDAVKRFVDGLLDPAGAFLKAFLPFQRRLSALGKRNSLSCLALKLGSPGACDTYQGTEIWDYSLVDPDNRREVDFAARTAMLSMVDETLKKEDRAATLRSWLESYDPKLKLLMLCAGLRVRRRFRSLFVGGEYLPLQAAGPKEGHIVAFARRDGPRWAVAAGARFFSRLAEPGDWEGTSVLLPEGLRGRALRDVFTGRPLSAAAEGPAALPAADLFSALGGALAVTQD